MSTLHSVVNAIVVGITLFGTFCWITLLVEYRVRLDEYRVRPDQDIKVEVEEVEHLLIKLAALVSIMIVFLCIRIL
jgi:hypothetical protein